MASKLIIAVNCLLLAIVHAGHYSSAYDYTQERRLASMVFETSATRGVGSCYNAEYYYYKSWKCGSAACKDEANSCPSTDPMDPAEDEAKEERARLVSVVIPSIVGGCCILLICCLCCGAYYGSSYGVEYYQKQ